MENFFHAEFSKTPIREQRHVINFNLPSFKPDKYRKMVGVEKTGISEIWNKAWHHPPGADLLPLRGRGVLLLVQSSIVP